MSRRLKSSLFLE
ncbi:unnamed protein product [Linum tenue]|uniref:Uncharacterized protein n=1 Tax=Linum tenue TaxID=586396 RepID=A0AAV0PPF8_9ROSI|nr:unnamed protein product [Linum tenue]